MVAILPKTDSGPSTNFFTSVTGSYTRFLVYSSSLYPSLSSFTVSTYSDKNCRPPMAVKRYRANWATPYPVNIALIAPYFSVSVFNSLFNASYSLSDSIFFLSPVSVANTGVLIFQFFLFPIRHLFLSLVVVSVVSSLPSSRVGLVEIDDDDDVPFLSATPALPSSARLVESEDDAKLVFTSLFSPPPPPV